MISPSRMDYCNLPQSESPRLVVVVDTEEEYDWARGKCRGNVSVRSVRAVEEFQRIVEGYNLKPLFVLDYPVASQSDGYRPLVEIHAAGECAIGAHMHPWVNPPFEEELISRNTFPGNLSRNLEAAKLKILSDCVGERFGIVPVMYKAGRYGIGKHTAEILEEQGYEVDLSVCPMMDYSNEGGPDFRGSIPWPYRFGKSRRLLELPMTVGFTGLLRHRGRRLYDAASMRILQSVHAIGALARFRLLDRVWLSPEGYTLPELRRLTRALFDDGLRVFSFAFHSPSLVPGNTPYVRTIEDRDRFISRCRQYFDFFFGELKGQPGDAMELKEQLVYGTGVNE